MANNQKPVFDFVTSVYQQKKVLEITKAGTKVPAFPTQLHKSSQKIGIRQTLKIKPCESCPTSTSFLVENLSKTLP